MRDFEMSKKIVNKLEINHGEENPCFLDGPAHGCENDYVLLGIFG